MTNKPTDWQALCADIIRASDEGDFLAAIDNARLALAQPEPEGLTDGDTPDFDSIFHEHAGHQTQAFMPLMDVQEFSEASWEILARWGRAAVVPVPVSERPWEREGEWLDPDGECWWCPPDGVPFWMMANPAMVYAGWLLPHHALPLPQQPH
jgi:hypothetical protein